MRTLAATASTAAQAEHICSRLRELDIPKDRIVVKDLGEAADAEKGGILITVKVTPEQLSAATDILKGAEKGGEEALPPSHDTEPVSGKEPIARPQQAQARPATTEASSPIPAPARERVARPAVRRSGDHAAEPTGDVRDRSSSTTAAAGAIDFRGAVRIVLFAILLAALGVALGALVGTLI